MPIILRLIVPVKLQVERHRKFCFISDAAATAIAIDADLLTTSRLDKPAKVFQALIE